MLFRSVVLRSAYR